MILIKSFQFQLLKFIFMCIQKTTSSIILISIVIFLSSCIKDSQNDSLTKYRALSTIKYKCGNTQYTSNYFYNANKFIVKITNSDIKGNIFSCDTIYYNSKTSNIDSLLHFVKVDSLNSFQLSETNIYSYSNNNINSIIKKGTYQNNPYTKTYNFTYNGSSLQSITTSGDPAGNNSSFTNIQYLNGTITSFDYNPTGIGSTFHLSVVSVDTYNNVNLYSVLTPNNLIEFISVNNINQVITTNEGVFNGKNISANSNFIYNTYSYYTYDNTALVTSKIVQPTFYNQLSVYAEYTYTYTYL